MWPFIRPISLIRYLIVWRVTSSLVVLPVCFSQILSEVLGAIITESLPTREAKEWEEALSDEDPSWPIEAVLFPYSSKRHHGRGEPILWELKLLGDSADHKVFLELILPAMEQAASTTDRRWHRHNWLWGEFAVEAVYAARGKSWEPVVSDSKLDLDYRADPAQWAEGLTWGRDVSRRYHNLSWRTPFNLEEMPDVTDNAYSAENEIEIPVRAVPTLGGIVKALMERMTIFLPQKYPTLEDVRDLLSKEEQEKLRGTLGRARRVSRRQNIALESVSKCAGRWVGGQRFARPIPQSLLPYLELASILHVGEETHFGCGTFKLS